MSFFIHNETCPRCRANGHDLSGDNLAVYSDNHKWCWRCGYFEKGDITKSYISKPKVNSKGLEYPQVVPFSEECLEYLYQYDLTDDEIYGNLNGHVDGYSFFTDKFFLVRRLHKKPKVIIKGEVAGNEPIFGCQDSSDTIVLVEDILSAIKVSRIIDSCSLLGTHLHDILLVRLANMYSNCILWLDADMYEHMSKKLMPRIKPYFKQVRIIMSEKDPKYYSTDEIKEKA